LALTAAMIVRPLRCSESVTFNADALPVVVRQLYQAVVLRRIAADGVNVNGCLCRLTQSVVAISTMTVRWQIREATFGDRRSRRDRRQSELLEQQVESLGDQFLLRIPFCARTGTSAGPCIPVHPARECLTHNPRISSAAAFCLSPSSVTDRAWRMAAV